MGIRFFWLTLMLIAGPSHATSEQDPWEGFNRGVWRFNEIADRWVVRPIAVGYKAITPDIIESGISNVFRNVNSVPTALNNLIQGKPGRAGQDMARFVFNFTFGVFGLYDIASDIGLPIHEEDFGQTLGVWGLPQGPYMILPIVGPSTVRDTGGWLVDMQYELYSLITPESDRHYTQVLRVTDLRAGLLRLDGIAPGDQYLFFRDAYLQRRAGLVRDGRRDETSQDDFITDDF